MRNESTADTAIQHLSLIKETTLSDEEVFYLRHLHQKYNSADSLEALDILFQNLWSVYGATFGDDCLLYAALAMSAKSRMQRESVIDEGIFWDFISRFQKSLISAIQKCKVSECHLFAIYLALSLRPMSSDFFKTHSEGFVRVLETLYSNAQTISRRLQYLDHLVLRWVRVYLRYEMMIGSTELGSILLDMHTVAETLPVTERLCDPRAGDGLPLRATKQISMGMTWWQLLSIVREDSITLFICFRSLFASKDAAANTICKVTQTVDVLRRRLYDISMLPCVTDLLDDVCLQQLS